MRMTIARTQACWNSSVLPHHRDIPPIRNPLWLRRVSTEAAGDGVRGTCEMSAALFLGEASLAAGIVNAAAMRVN